MTILVRKIKTYHEILKNERSSNTWISKTPNWELEEYSNNTCCQLDTTKSFARSKSKHTEHQPVIGRNSVYATIQIEHFEMAFRPKSNITVSVKLCTTSSQSSTHTCLLNTGWDLDIGKIYSRKNVLITLRNRNYFVLARQLISSLNLQGEKFW